MDWQAQLKGDSFSWLRASEKPVVRYLTLRDLQGLPPDDPELLAARELAHTQGEIAAILAAMHPDGYWVKPGPGYSPKYTSTVWALILLAQLGASAHFDERIARACGYILDFGMTPQGQFTATGMSSGTADCLQGNLCAALTALDCVDPRLERAYEWMARSVTGDGVASASEQKAPLRYYATGKCGPNFSCGANNKLPCSWGAAKVMLAFAHYPQECRTPPIERAIGQGVDFIFSVDPATAAWPSGYAAKPSGNWWKFGFPLFYVADLLQVVEALVVLGYGNDARLASALQIIRDKQDAQGRWSLDYDYSGKTWGDFGKKKEPSPWVTLRVLRVLKNVV